MQHKSEVRHRSKCQAAVETTVTVVDSGSSNVPSQKQKEDAKQILYFNRI